jgi:catechol 2,3-dioxygenase-like lactoylglutathione lyase family enzyme
MRIIGPDSVVFGVNNLEDCHQYLLDYGLSQVDTDSIGGDYESLDGTSVCVYDENDERLPPPLPTGNTLRQVIWGCEDQVTVDEVAAELGKDRDLVHQPDGSFWCQDDLGFEIAFRATTRREVKLSAELINSPGATPLRPVNALGTDSDTDARPRSLSHVVIFVPDYEKLEKFYAERLGFTTTDRFTNVGPFMRAASNSDHHSLFMLQTPPHMQGLEHLAFHVQGPNEVMVAGSRFKAKGYETFWGPGRHIFGSNWFWYFNSPFGCHFEYDADMDLHDDDWVARETEVNAEKSQTFLFENVDKWFPGGGPPDH